MVVVEFNKTIRVRDGCRQGLRTFAFISSCNSFSTCRLTINLSQYMGQRIVVSVLLRPNEIFLVRFFATELDGEVDIKACLGRALQREFYVILREKNSKHVSVFMENILQTGHSYRIKKIIRSIFVTRGRVA